MQISNYIVKALNRVDFRARNKEQALAQIAALACKSPQLRDMDEAALFRLLQEREAVVTTGIGNGIAIPHTRVDQLEDFVVFVLVSPEGIDFEALDRRKVQLFFVVLAPTHKVNEHLKLLAGLSHVLGRTGIKTELVKIRDADIQYEVLCRYFSGSGMAEVVEQRRKRKLMILVLYYEDILQDILEYLIDVDVDGATIIRSEGMGAHISGLPLFASFMGFMREDRQSSHTLMALIPESDETEILQGIEAITGDLDKTQGAVLMTLDLRFCKGTMNMI